MIFLPYEPCFPATYSTLSPSALASLILEKYDIGAVQCTFLLRGVGGTYLVEASDKRFILRVYRNSHRSLEHIQMETSLLLALKEADVPVSYPIQDHSGEAIQTLDAVEGTRHVVLFSYAPGTVVSKLSEQQLRTLGTQMARLHHVSSTVEATRQAEDKLRQLSPSGFSSGYCHFDFLPKNFHFEGDSVTFFDFDFMGHGWLVNDIMTFWQHLCLDVHFGRIKQEEADEAYAIFLKAYRAIRPVSEQELEAVPYLSLGFWLFYMEFHTTHDQFYPFVQPGHLKLRTDLIRQLMERYW